MSSELIPLIQRQTLILEALLQNSQTTSKAIDAQNQQMSLWRQNNPELTNLCTQASQHLGEIQAEFFKQVVEELIEKKDSLADGNFMLMEFLDKYGQRLAHLQTLVSTITQLGATNGTNNP